MKTHQRRFLAGCAIALASTLIALGLTLMVQALSRPTTFLFFVLAVIISAWRGGAGYGLLASFLSVAILDLYVLSPVHNLHVKAPGDILRLAVLMLVSVLISGIDSGRQRAEKALSRQERQFRTLVEHFISPLTLVSADGRILYLSPAFTDRLGYTPDESVCTEPRDLIHPGDQSTYDLMFYAVVQDRQSTTLEHVRLRHKNGHWIALDVTATNLLDNPDISAVVVIYQQRGQKMESGVFTAGSQAEYAGR